MADILKDIPIRQDDNLLVGFNQADDAGVYKISDRQALVQTVDFFPPIVDDPYSFGQIAAANALSDIYAMGGKPLTAMNIVGFPPGMPPSVLTKILKGGADKINEAGAVVVGGHSVKDKELKYGVSCTGLVNIFNIIKNSGARRGDYLFMTKALGTGILTTAIKQNKATPEDIERVTELMIELNKTVSGLMVRHQAHAATDITGFGILGHAFEIANASNVSLEIVFDKLPLLENALKYAEAGALTGGASANQEYLESRVEISASLSKPRQDILFDPQTSGGMLIALSPEVIESFIEDAHEHELAIAEIGRVKESGDFSIRVI